MDAPRGSGPFALAVLLRRAGHGDHSAFARVYDATSARSFGLALGVLGDRVEAEDALLDAYVEIWRRCGRLDTGDAGPMAWILTIVYRSAVDRVGSAAAQRVWETERQVLESAGGRHSRMEATISPEVFARANDPSELTAEQRADLVYFAAHTHADIGHLLGFGRARTRKPIRQSLGLFLGRSGPA